MILTADLAEFLQTVEGLTSVAYVLDAMGFQGVGTQPAIMITMGNGPGFAVERLTDTQLFQIQVRGPQQDRTSQAQMLARRIDTALVTAKDHGPLSIGGQAVVSVNRSGGPPSQLGPRETGSYAVIMSCNYLVECDSGVG